MKAETIGKLKVDLAEYVGSGSSARVVGRQFLLQQSKMNSSLRVCSWDSCLLMNCCILIDSWQLSLTLDCLDQAGSSSKYDHVHVECIQYHDIDGT